MTTIFDRMEKLPGDLLAAAALSVLTLFFTLVPPLASLPIRIPLGLVMVLFLPGYALIAALFPRKDDLDGIERVALSVGLSIAVVPLMGLGLNYTHWGIRLVPVVISLCLFTVVMVLAAHLRRSALSQEERFSVGFRQFFTAIHSELINNHGSSVERTLTVILVIVIILSVSALVYVVVTPQQGEKFTDFYILGPEGKAYDYPTSVVSGQNSTVIVGIVNHEYIPVNYTMQIAIQNTTFLNRDVWLEDNETWEKPVSYTLRQPGDNQKLEFLLYKEYNFTAPYRDLHLWVNVSSRNEFKGNELIRNSLSRTN
jgi:uncharacterized membrane protein